MFKSIVVGLDGSDESQRALTFAVPLARRDDAKLVIAHIEEDIVGKGGGPIHATEDEIRAEIDRQAKELAAGGIDTSVKASSIMLGGPAPAIVKIADEADADLIVVGSRGHSAAIGMLLGSVAPRLLHLAHQPVMVIPAGVQAVGNGEPAATETPAAAG